jgi:hypothetical protein
MSSHPHHPRPGPLRRHHHRRTIAAAPNYPINTQTIYALAAAYPLTILFWLLTPNKTPLTTSILRLIAVSPDSGGGSLVVAFLAGHSRRGSVAFAFVFAFCLSFWSEAKTPASAFGFAGLIKRREGRFLWVAARAMYKGSEVLKHSVVLMNLDHWGNRLAL